MYRLWGIIRKNNKMIRDMVVEYRGDDLSEEQKLRHCIGEICYAFDLQRPMLFPKNMREYNEYNRIVLNQDNFTETIHFDTMELEVIEND